MNKLYTIGYGGRTPQQLIEALHAHQIKDVVDVRLRPDRASMGFYKLAKDEQKGIQGLFSREGIEYHSHIELGNLFLDFGEAYRKPYERLLEASGLLLTERLQVLLSSQQGICLLCSEKNPSQCHRLQITDFLSKKCSLEIQHLL